MRSDSRCRLRGSRRAARPANEMGLGLPTFAGWTRGTARRGTRVTAGVSAGSAEEHELLGAMPTPIPASVARAVCHQTTKRHHLKAGAVRTETCASRAERGATGEPTKFGEDEAASPRHCPAPRGLTRPRGIGSEAAARIRWRQRVALRTKTSRVLQRSHRVPGAGANGGAA